MTNWVSVRTILQTVVASVDFGRVAHYCGETLDEKRTNFWVEVISRKAADTGFGHLVESILKNGFDTNSAIGWDNHRITEGHHRLVAAILLGMDEVPVSTNGGHSSYGVCAHVNDNDEYPIFGLGYMPDDIIDSAYYN